MNRIVHAIVGTILFTGDYPVHVNKIVNRIVPARVGSNCVNKIVPGEQNRSKYEQNRSKYEQNSPREQDSTREQNSPCTDAPVHAWDTNFFGTARCFRAQTLAVYMSTYPLLLVTRGFVFAKLRVSRLSG